MMDTLNSAQKMLEDIQSESLHTLLNDVRNETAPLGRFGITSLDAYLFSHTRHPSPDSSVNRGDVIEVQGAASSGKSHFVQQAIITCVLPSRAVGHNLGGWGKAAILLDTDGTFDIERFRCLLRSRLLRFTRNEPSGSAHSETWIEDAMEAGLKRLHVFQPASSLQLTATLIHLSQYHANHLPDDEIALLAVDSISAFYWPDRFTTEQMGEDNAPANASLPSAIFAHPLHHVLVALERFRASHGAVVLLSNWGLTPLPGDGVPFFRQHLHPYPVSFNAVSAREPAALSAATQQRPAAHPTGGAVPAGPHSGQGYPRITHHITLVPQSVKPLATRLSLAEAIEQEATFRSDAVRRREVVGLIRKPCADTGAVGRFTMRIDNDGAVMDE